MFLLQHDLLVTKTTDACSWLANASVARSLVCVTLYSTFCLNPFPLTPWSFTTTLTKGSEGEPMSCWCMMTMTGLTGKQGKKKYACLHILIACFFLYQISSTFCCCSFSGRCWSVCLLVHPIGSDWSISATELWQGLALTPVQAFMVRGLWRSSGFLEPYLKLSFVSSCWKSYLEDCHEMTSCLLHTLLQSPVTFLLDPNSRRCLFCQILLDQMLKTGFPCCHRYMPFVLIAIPSVSMLTMQTRTVMWANIYATQTSV